MRLRILVFEDDVNIRDILVQILTSKGHDVFAYPDPTACPVYNHSACACAKNLPCADLLITDINMPNMSGLDLLASQQQQGCQILPQHKAVISADLSGLQRDDLKDLDCRTFRKPFRFSELLAWVDECEAHTLQGRQLTPFDKTA
jgi:CheY-like chemotaxis protein